MLRVVQAAVFISLLFAGSVFAQSTPPTGKSPGEIAAASRLLAEKHEICRLEAKEQHLHLLERRTFMRACMKKKL